MKEQLKHYIQEHMEEYKYLVNDLYEHPEIGNQEFRSMRVLCKMLRKEGFEGIRGTDRLSWCMEQWKTGACHSLYV